MIAPTAPGLLRVARSWSPNQLLQLPPSFRSSNGAAPLFMIKAKQFLVDVGHEQILPAVTIEVSRIYTHAGTRGSRITVGHSGREANLFKFPVALVQKEKVGYGVVRHEKIHQAVIVDVGRHGAERLAERVNDAGFSAYVLELAVAFVMKKVACARLEDARHAIIAATQAIIATEDRPGAAVFDKARV